MFATVLAHQGGWDEILLVAAPLLILAAIVRMAKQRADRLVPLDEPGPDLTHETTPDTGPDLGSTTDPEVSPDAPPTRPVP